ncbi:MAG: nucleoside 2-deoxyribosyltransferase [Dehalococcoidia bacterium]|jgi:nucleoside 2-deoxyribosyltransferase
MGNCILPSGSSCKSKNYDMKDLLIYLAGPDVFRANAMEHFAEMKALCNKYDFEGMSPFDNENVFKGEQYSKEHGVFIFKINVNVIKLCDVIIANLVPFRGACIDDGTAWEMGCGYANNKILYGYTPWCYRTLVASTPDFLINVTFPNVEHFGDNCVNLMIQHSIELSGGEIFPSFERCLIDLREKYDKADSIFKK